VQKAFNMIRMQKMQGRSWRWLNLQCWMQRKSNERKKCRISHKRNRRRFWIKT